MLEEEVMDITPPGDGQRKLRAIVQNQNWMLCPDEFLEIGQIQQETPVDANKSVPGCELLLQSGQTASDEFFSTIGEMKSGIVAISLTIADQLEWFKDPAFLNRQSQAGRIRRLRAWGEHGGVFAS